MKKILLCTLLFIFAFGFVPTSAANVPSEYQTYLDKIGDSWYQDMIVNYGNFNVSNISHPISSTEGLSIYCWSTINYPQSDYSGSYVISTPITFFISGSGSSYNCTPTGYDPMYCQYNTTKYLLWESYSAHNISAQASWGEVAFVQNYAPNMAEFTFSNTELSTILNTISKRFRNVNIIVNGQTWFSVGSSYTIETEIELPCDIQAVDSSFNFFNGGYGVTWKQGEYNWIQSGPLENVTRTMVWTVSYPTVSYVQSLYNQSFIESTPLDVVRNAFSTVFNSGTSIYDIPEQYRATTNFFINIDSPELGSSYHISYDSTNQQWALTQNEYSYSLANGYQFNTGFFKQLYQLYGDADLFSIALCYITPVRVSMYAVDDTQGIIYNPLSIYWLDLKQSNGTVLEYRNFGSQTTVSDDNVTDDTTSNDSVTGDDTPFVNPSDEQLNTNYNNSIQNSYNHTVNNYYNYNDINTDLLDYYLSFRDGGTEQDVQDAFGYLNSTISSLSNVPVVLHNLFYNFFPLPVIRLMQALFIVFMVFMIIIIIKHLFR